jgi:hypothetical protein
MASRAILQVFENYQQSRTTFVQTIAELASRPQNIEALQNAGVMALLRPLLLDTVPSIQQSAALALGRLANYSEALAEAVVMNEVLPQLVYSLSDQNVLFLIISHYYRSQRVTQRPKSSYSDSTRRLPRSCCAPLPSILPSWRRMSLPLVRWIRWSAVCLSSSRR